MATRAISRVNLLNQSGLLSSSAMVPRACRLLGREGFVAHHDGRLSRNVCRNDAYMILHKNLDPIASPTTQRFLQDATRDLGNSQFENSKHPTLQFQIPQREIKPRIVPTYPPALSKPSSPIRKRRCSENRAADPDEDRLQWRFHPDLQ
jgi:hypothetical protein